MPDAPPPQVRYQRDGQPRSAAAFDFTGTWANERGSEMSIEQVGNQLVGTYMTNVGEPDAVQAFPLTGFGFGAQATFTVDFSVFGSLTAWTGRVEDGALVTLWHLVTLPDSPDDAWASIRAGSSRFTRLP